MLIWQTATLEGFSRSADLQVTCQIAHKHLDSNTQNHKHLFISYKYNYKRKHNNKTKNKFDNKHIDKR